MEYYHSIVWKNNNEVTFFDKFCELSKSTISQTVKSYEKLCKEPLKVALYLERKIRNSRESKGANSKRTKDWVLKYEKFLKLPMHDLFLSLLVSKHKVIEYFEGGSVNVLCLNCPVLRCSGCIVSVAEAAKVKEKKKLKVAIRVKNTKNKGNYLI